MLWYIYWGAYSLIYGVFEYSDMIWISPPEDIEQGPKDTLCSPVIPDPFVPHNMCFVMISNFPWVKPLTAMLCSSQEIPSTFTSSLGCRMHLHVISFPPPSTWINPSTLYLKLILVFNDVIAATKRPGREEWRSDDHSCWNSTRPQHGLDKECLGFRVARFTSQTSILCCS